MKLTVTGHQVAVTDAQRATIVRRTAVIRRLLGRAALSVQVVVSHERALTVCELTLHARGDHVLHGRGRDKHFAVALGAAIDRVRSQAQKLVDRWKSRRKGDEA